MEINVVTISLRAATITYTLEIVGGKNAQHFNQHRVTYCPHNYWLKFAQLMLGNQFAMWLGKLNCHQLVTHQILPNSTIAQQLVIFSVG